MKKLSLTIAILLTACTNSSNAKRTLEDAGYTEVRTTGYGGPMACGEDDWSTTSFEALNPAGNKNVKGVVCCGLIKGCTIRH